MKHWILAPAAALAIIVGAAAELGATTLRVTMQLPESDALSQNWLEFGRLVEERSGGEIKVQLFASSQLFKDDQVPEAVGSGAIDAGSASLVRYAGAVPAVNVVSVPFLLDSEAAIRAATAPNSRVRILLDAAIQAQTNNRVLWWQAFGRNIYLSKGFAITEPTDFTGRKVRTYGTVQSWTAQALGGAPTIISGSEQFLAYQQRTVDIGMTGASAVASRKLYEVMDHMTLSYDSAIEFIAVINNDVFESLPADQQKIILDTAVEVENKLRDFMITDEDSLVDGVRDKMTVVDLTDVQRAAFRDATSGVVDRFVAQAGDLGAAVVAAARGL